MAKSITIKAETVEKALEQALGILGLTIDEVHIHVDRPAGKSLFGFKRIPAEITVTQLEKKRQGQVPSEMKNTTTAGARICNGKLEARFAEQSFPIVSPAQGVELEVNGEKIEQRTILLPTDRVECRAISEDLAAVFVIRLAKDHMTATAAVTPGKRIIRTLQDTRWEAFLHIRPIEEIIIYNELTEGQFIEELNSIGITTGICRQEIKRAANTEEAKDFIIATGTPAVAGKDAQLDIHVKFEKEEHGEHERVDFREHNLIPTVKAGQLIAACIPPVSGKDGVDLFGRLQPAKKPKELIVRPGKNTQFLSNKIFAKIDGRPIVERRGNAVKVEVNPEYRLSADVNLESGNIYFEGDVWIGGSVHPSMFVAASGIITIMKNTTKSSIRGSRSVWIHGSIFSSTVTVGIQEKTILILVEDLDKLRRYLENIESALIQIFTLRGEDPDLVEPFTLKQALQLLLEQKYSEFIYIVEQFIQVVKNHSRRLEKEWLQLSEQLYSLFLDSRRETRTTMKSLRKLLEETNILLHIYTEEIQPESILQASFALNSILYSNGSIHITRKGVYNCSITALCDVKIKDVCRGGEVIAGRNAELDESGSNAGVKTKISVKEDGIIRIAKAYPGTIIQVGTHRHEFLAIAHKVTASIAGDGTLSLN